MRNPQDLKPDISRRGTLNVLALTIYRIDIEIEIGYRYIYRNFETSKLSMRSPTIISTYTRIPVLVHIIIKMKMHSSCEIADFIETHLCKLCDTPPIAYYGVCVLINIGMTA